MKFTDNQMVIAKEYFGLPEKCLYGLPDSLEEGMGQILKGVQDGLNEDEADMIGQKIVGVANLFSLLSAKILDECYTNEVSQTMFAMAKESKEAGSTAYKEAKPELKALIGRVLAELT